jgi:hypothetical protein
MQCGNNGNVCRMASSNVMNDGYVKTLIFISK